MAIQWSGYDSAGNNAMRVGIDASVGSVSNSSSTVKMTFKIYTGNRYNYSQTGQKLTYSGSAGSGSKTFSNTQGSGTTTLRDTQTYTYTYSSSSYGSSPGSRTFTAKLSGTYNGSTPSKTVTVTIPARPIAAPAAPTGISASRSYSTSATVRWTNRSTAAKPYTSMTLQRNEQGSSTWTTVWTGTGSSRTVTGLSLAKSYRFRVRANNSKGSSGWITTGYYAGIGVPATPTGMTATRSSDSSIATKWTNRSTTAAPYQSLTMQRRVGSDGTFANWWSTSSIVSSHAVSTSVTANNVYQFRIRANNSAGSSGWATSGWVYTTPGAPTSATATLGTNGRVTVKWKNNVRYTSYYLQIQRLSGGTWSFVNSNLAGGSTSWVDTSPGAGTAIQYRVRAVSSVGTLTSAWATTSALSTAPGAPTTVKAATQANNTVKVTWKNQTKYTTYTSTIQRSVAGGTWTTMVTGLASGVTSWTDSSPGAGNNQYRVRNVGIASQTSAYVNSNTVSTIVAPKAPSGLSPNGQTVDLNDDQQFTWTHNDGGDGADQSVYQVRISSDGGTTWTSYPQVASTDSAYLLPAGTLSNGQTYQWQVRTQGIASMGWGPWSATATFTGSSTPVVTITSPTDPQTSSPLTATWEYDQAELSPQARWEAVLYDARMNPLETLTGTGDAGTARFSWPLEQGETYTVRVRGQSGSGLWSPWASQTFTMDLLPPAEVILDPSYDGDTGTTSVGITGLMPEDGVSAPIDHIDLQRRITPCLGPGSCTDEDNLGEQGDWTTIVTGIQLPTDYEPGVPAATNMIPDPSLEYTEEHGYAGFQPSGNALLGTDLDHVHSGEQALKIETTGAGTNAVIDPAFNDRERNVQRWGADATVSAGVATVPFPTGTTGPRFWLIGDKTPINNTAAPTSGWQTATPGDTWQFAIEANPDDEAKLRLQINWRYSDGTTGAATYPAMGTYPAEEWSVISGSAVVPANAIGFFMAMIADANQTDFLIQVRNPYASKIQNSVADPTFQDTDLNTQRFGEYSTEQVTATNMAIDPSCTRSGVSWSTGGAATVTAATDWKKFGTTSCKIVSTGSANAAAYIPAGGNATQIEVTPGEVTASAYWHTDAASLTGVRPYFYITLTYNDGTEANAAYARSDEGDPTALDGRVSVTFTVPPNCLRWGLRLMNASTTTGATVWWDGILVQTGTDLGEYFDGDTAATADYAYRWKGDPAVSASEQYVPASGATIANGVASLALTKNASGPRFWLIGNRAPSYSSSPPGSGWLPVTGGDTWLFSVDLNPSTSYKLRIQINWRYADGTQSSGSYPIMGTYPANTWSKLTGSAVAPDNAIGVYMSAIADGAQGDVTLQIRNPSAARIGGLPGVFARAVFEAEQGKRYTFSGWRWTEGTSSAAAPVNLAIGGSDATSGVTEENTDPASPNQWQQFTATVGASADGPAYLYLYGLDTNGQTVIWDDLGLTEGTEPVDFSGDTESDGSWNYTWEGEPGNSNSLQTDAGIVSNLAIDPSLSGAAEWTAASGATVTVDDEWAKFGDTSMKIVSGGLNGAAAIVPAPTGPQIKVVPGPTVASVYWHTDPGSDEFPTTGLRPFFTIYMEFTDGTATVANYAQSNQGDPADGDGRCACLFTVPDNCARWSVRFINGSATSGATIWWDGLLIQTGHDVNDYFDGDTPQDYEWSYHWAGDPGVGPSERIGQPNLSVLDTQPVTCGLNEYRAVVTSTAPSQSVSKEWEVYADGVDDGQWLFLSWSDGFATVARARCNPQTSETVGRNRSSTPLLGAHRPVLLVGTNTERAVDVSAELAWGRFGSGSSPVADFRACALEANLVLYRDYTGRRIYGMMSELSIEDGVPGMATISFTVTEARHIEALAFVGGEPYEPNAGEDDGGDGVDNAGGEYDVDTTGLTRGFKPLDDMPIASASPGQSL